MFSKNLFVALPVLMMMPLALGVPLNPANDTDSLLVRRGGENHEATVWSSPGCSGTDLLSVPNFGCGGTCYPVSNAVSILLQQDTTKQPHPSANLYSDSNCQNFVAKAGIYSGEHTGCTDTSYGVYSLYLYYNC
ncbi:hypothetical protein V8E54_011176 [Elaphomyces granulatus]